MMRFHATALVTLEHAAAAVKADEAVNRLEVALDDMCSHLIVKRQPAANDVRTVMGDWQSDYRYRAYR